MMPRLIHRVLPLALLCVLSAGTAAAAEETARGYRVYVTNERSGDVTVIDNAMTTLRQFIDHLSVSR